jgi:hypothetical protein
MAALMPAAAARVGGHADRELAIPVVHAQPDLERLDVALGAADVALRGKASVDAAIDDGPLALFA